MSAVLSVDTGKEFVVNGWTGGGMGLSAAVIWKVAPLAGFYFGASYVAVQYLADKVLASPVTSFCHNLGCGNQVAKLCRFVVSHGSGVATGVWFAGVMGLALTTQAIALLALSMLVVGIALHVFSGSELIF